MAGYVHPNPEYLPRKERSRQRPTRNAGIHHWSTDPAVLSPSSVASADYRLDLSAESVCDVRCAGPRDRKMRRPSSAGRGTDSQLHSRAWLPLGTGRMTLYVRTLYRYDVRHEPHSAAALHAVAALLKV